MCQNLYWTGGSGDWNNPLNWSSQPGSTGGAGIPDKFTDIIIPETGSPVSIHFSMTEFQSLVIEQNSSPVILSGEGIHSFGNVILSDSTKIRISDWQIKGADINFDPANAYIRSAIQINTGNKLDLLNNLSLQEGSSLTLVSGQFNSNGFGISSPSLNVDANNDLPTLNLETSRLNIFNSIHLEGISENSQLQNAELYLSAQLESVELADWNFGSIIQSSLITTCGTGAGQTPFTIEAVVVTNYNGKDVSCNGASDGSATVNVSGGVGPFVYQWIGGDLPGFNQNYNNLGAGTYTVIVTDQGQGIPCVDNVELSEPPPITVFQLVLTPPSCEGLCNGTGTSIPIGGVPGYDFDWSNGETNQSASALCEGSNTLTITDSNGCVFDSTFVLVREPLVFNLVTEDILCFGTATGTASVNPEGGAGPAYTITWSNTDTGPSTSGLDAGPYTVTVVDAANCSSDTSFTITEEPPIELILDDIVDESCPGNADGEILISVNGGLPDFDFDWTGPNGFTDNTEDPSGLLAGDYDLTLTDANGCEIQGSYTVDAPEALDLAVVIDAIPCAGETTGAIDLTITGGVPNYVVLWTGPNSYTNGNEDISGLEAGTYTVLVTDDNDCTITMDYEVSEPSLIEVTETITHPLCSGTSTGAIDIDVMGGSPDYDFDWTGPSGFSSTSEDISGLEEGTYDLTVTDSNGCFVDYSFSLTDPDPLTLDFDGTPISCFGAADATIDLSVSGGNPDYFYDWTGPNGFTSDQEDIEDLGPGTYQILVTDMLGCTVNGEVIINDPLAISILGVVTQVSCGGLSDGEIELSVLGGSPGYVFSWTGPNGFTSSDEDLTGLAAGTYDVTVIDIAGCEETAQFEVMEEPPLEVLVTTTDIDCNGAGNGSIELEISGGVTPYDVVWTGPNSYASTDEDIFNLEAGDYSFSITDDNDCPFLGSATIIEAAPIEVVVIPTDLLCDGDTNGSIELIITGGQEPYTVTWDNGDSGIIITDLPAGTYIPTIVDDLNCEIILDPITLNSPPAIEVTLVITPVVCNGEANGAIELDITGGTPDYSVDWTGPNGFVSGDEDIFNLEEGTYDYTVTDASGCVFTGTADVSAPESIDITAVMTPLVCASELGDIDITVDGGSPDYTYEWSGPNAFTAATEDISNLPQGSYSVIVTDINDCIGQASFDLVAPDPIVIDAVVTPLDCSGDDNGAIELNISGGQPAYFVNWTGPNGYSSVEASIFDLAEGEYAVNIEDQNGCLLDSLFTLTQPPLLELTATISEPLCAQQNTGAIDVEVTGGFPTYVFTWTGPDGFGSPAEDISNLNPGDYSLHIEDQGSCVLDTTFTLQETPGIIIDANVTDTPCGNDVLGSIELEVSGGMPDYIFLWDGPEGYVSIDEDIFDLEPGTYDLELADANGCSIDTTFEITAPVPIELEFTVIQPICSESNGSIDVLATGGQVAVDYTYTWYDVSDGPPVLIGNTALIENLSSGLYQVDVTDDNGCLVSDLVPLTDQPLNAEFEFDDILCNGDTTASINLTILDGMDPYDITWSGPDGYSSSDEDIFNLAAGQYILAVVDFNGCVINEVIDILEPDALVLDPEKTDIFCNGGNNGAIDTETFGGTEPYIYSWTGPDGFLSDQQNINGLAPGEYVLNLIDDNNCAIDSTITIVESTTIDIDLVITEILCFGSTDGSIDLTVNGGTPPYEFNWTGPNGFAAFNEDLINLLPGDYNLNLFDVNDCLTDTTVTILEAPELLVDVISIQPSCGAENGSFEATASGGQVLLDYQYIWYDISDGNSTVISTDPLVENLPAGIYYLEVFDDLGCSFTQTLNLSDMDGQIDADITDVLCFGDSNGTIAITITGATEPYDITWAGPNGFTAITQNISDLESGMYTVIVDDALGCTYSDIFELGSPDPISFDITITPILCNGDSNGGISVVVNGGTSPFDINWFGDGGFSMNGPEISNLPAGCYDLVVSDNNFCQADSTICIIEPELISSTAIVSDILCGGTPTGSIDLTAAGGTEPYFYEWIGPDGFNAGSEDINLIFTGSYDLLITDSNDCEFQTSYFVDENLPLTVDPLVVSPLCPGDFNGSIDLNPGGGTDPLSVEWLGPNAYTGFGTPIEDLESGVYTYILSDDLGCFITADLQLIDPLPLEVLNVVTSISCFGDGNGSIELQIEGGTPDYFVFWTGPNGYSNVAEDIFNLEAGSYQYQVGDINACTTTGTLLIEEPQELILDLNNMVNANCSDSFDGLIDIDVSGGQPDYEFTWTGPNGYSNTLEDAQDLGPGIYGVNVVDQGGCSQGFNELEIIALTTVTAQTMADTTVCEGTGPWTLIGTNVGGVLSGWYDELGIQITDSDTLILEAEPGAHFYVYEASDDPCYANDTIFFTILSAPGANAGEDQLIFPDESVEIGGDPTTSSGYSVNWTPSIYLNDSTLYNPFTLGIEQDQWFVVEVTDLDGCTSSDSVRVGIIPEIIIPSGFSPNADNTNDLWIIENVGLYPSIEVEIYNRWGDLLYRNVGYTEPWDGRYDGEPLPIGTYYYVIDINEPEFEDEITGPLTILR